MFTILGATGFIGSHLVEYLQTQGETVWAPERGEPSILEKELGNVIYCIGLTADFRLFPIDTVRAHCCVLLDILERGNYSSFLYLSSGRMYRNATNGQEDAIFSVNPNDPDQLYDLSKLMGESICCSSKKSGIKIARLSNVYGPDWKSDNFIISIIRSAVDQRHIKLYTSLDSEKDYISINDLVRILPRIAKSGKNKTYNISRGLNVSNSTLVKILQNETKCTIEIVPQAPIQKIQELSNRLIVNEFGFIPSQIEDDLPELIQAYQETKSC